MQCRRSTSSSSGQPLTQDAPRMSRGNNAVVPQPGRGEDGMTFLLDASAELIHRCGRRGGGRRGGFDGLHDGGELVGAHDADFGVGPHPEKSGGVGAATVVFLVLV